MNTSTIRNSALPWSIGGTGHSVRRQNHCANVNKSKLLKTLETIGVDTIRTCDVYAVQPINNSYEKTIHVYVCVKGCVIKYSHIAETGIMKTDIYKYCSVDELAKGIYGDKPFVKTKVTLEFLDSLKNNYSDDTIKSKISRECEGIFILD